MPETDSTPEIWKPVTGFEGLYEVSNLGRIKRLAHIATNPNPNSWRHRSFPEKILKPLSTGYKSRYKAVSLYRDGVPTRQFIHRIVMAAFVGPCEEGKCVNHKDGNPTNNRLENLEYVTHMENAQHAMDNGLWNLKWKGRHKFSHDMVEAIRALSSAGWSQHRLASLFETTQSYICRIVNNVARNHLDRYQE